MPARVGRLKKLGLANYNQVKNGDNRISYLKPYSVYHPEALSRNHLQENRPS